MWDDVEKYLLDTDVVVNVSMISRYISPEQCRRIIEMCIRDSLPSFTAAIDEPFPRWQVMILEPSFSRPMTLIASPDT